MAEAPVADLSGADHVKKDFGIKSNLLGGETVANVKGLVHKWGQSRITNHVNTML